MKPFRSRALAFYFCEMLERVTGDRCRILLHMTSGGGERWIVVRYEPSGKMVDA